jgi:MFS family permease
MPKSLRIFLLFASAHFLSYFFRTANAVIARNLSQELNLDAAALGLMSSLFFAAFAAAQLPLGVGLDRWGPRWVTPGLMLFGALGSALFASGHSFAVVATGRALIGLGTAGILMGALKAFSRWFSPVRYATISSLMVAIGSCGSLVAATPLAILNVNYGWRAVFAVGALLMLTVAAAIMVGVSNAPPSATPLPVPASGEGIGTIFANLRFWRIAALTFCMNGVLLAYQGLWGGPYLLDVMGLDKLSSGNLLFLVSLGSTLGFATSGWLSDRFGVRRVVSFGAALLILCQAVFAWHPNVTAIGAASFLLGSSAATSIVLLSQARQLFPMTLTGRAVSATNLFGFAGTFVLQWAIGVILNRFSVDSVGRYPALAYSTAFVITAAGTLAALLWYWTMDREHL